MKLKRILAVCTALVATVSVAGGCMNNSNDSDGKVIISIMNYKGGIGDQWLYEAAERFEILNKDTDYGNGYIGVEITDEIQNGTASYIATMASDGYNIYFDQSGPSVNSIAQQGILYDLTEAITTPLTEYGEDVTIESKIAEGYRIMEKGNDGKYYGLPHYEYYPGLSYDIKLFDKYGLYIANEGGVKYNSKFGSVNFVEQTGAPKSVGPDCKAGTMDDGLPSTMQELLILCAKMKSLTISPLGLSGKYHDYSNYLVSALWASLAGYDKMETVYTFDGEIEVVTGYDSESLYSGKVGNHSYDIKKPKTEKITITEENGYRVYDMVEKYYASAFLEIAISEDWFSYGATHQTTHTEEQFAFIFSGENIVGKDQEKIGMLVEGSYWYNESAVEGGNLEEYYGLTGNTSRNIGWMNLPTSLDTPAVESDVAKVSVMLETGLSDAYINGNIKGKTHLEKACVDFIRFLYTDKELAAFTACTGVGKAALSYEMGDQVSNLEPFQKSIWELRNTNKVLYASAENATFLNSSASFCLNTAGLAFRYNNTKNFFDLMYNGTISAKDAFEASKMTEANWSILYKGEN